MSRIKAIIKKNAVAYRAARNIQALIIASEGLLRRRRGARDHLLSTLSMIRQSSYISGKPMNVTIEPTNICNLHCPVCETGAGVLGRPKRHMTLEEFKIIIDRIASHTNTLMFYFMGEPFINKESYNMIRYSKDCGIPFVTTCTNGDVVNPEKLVDSGIDEVSFQIGGISKETHGMYRIGSNLDRVLKNLQETIRFKNKQKQKMKIICGFILMKHNEHEVNEFKSKMSDMGVDSAVIIDPCVRTVEQGREMLPADKNHWFYDPHAFENNTLKPKVVPNNECQWLYYSVTIQANGDVVPCCRDAKGEYVMGNLLTQSLGEIWNGEKFRVFRDKLHKNQKQINMCRLCSGFGVSRIL